MPEQNAAPTIAYRVREILIEQLGVTPVELWASALLVDDLGCDSLDIVEVIFALEEEFRIQVPDEVFDRTGYTVGDVTELVKGLTA